MITFISLGFTTKEKKMGSCCAPCGDEDYDDFGKFVGVKTKMLSFQNGRVVSSFPAKQRGNRVMAATTWMMASQNGRVKNAPEPEHMVYLQCPDCGQLIWRHASRPGCVRCNKDHLNDKSL
jgi:predicted RNA-binding Zn-ribbon protein involved in translation (DUF1610 family)